MIPGTRDLVDWFPVRLEIADVLTKLDPTKYRYQLRHETFNIDDLPEFRYVYTTLSPANSGRYLTDVPTAQTIIEGNTIRILPPFSNVSVLDTRFLQNITYDNYGVLLMEAVTKTQKPIFLEVYDSAGQKVFETSLGVSIDGVEQMFRHKNLMKEMYQIEQQFPGIIPLGGVHPVAEHPVPNEGMPDRLKVEEFASPQHFLGSDSDSDRFDAETGKKNDFIHVHGYNVNGQDARGEHTEVFKRLYWSGSRARFWGVTWYGYDSQTQYPTAGTRSPNYHVNVRHAFNAGKLLTKFSDALKLQTATISAHSLGNMVVSTAIQNGMQIGRYLMTNPAVAEEAYISRSAYESEEYWKENTRPLMYNADWRFPSGMDNQYKPSLWRSEHYRLFSGDANDERRNLTWRNNFDRVRNDKTFIFYARTDEAFRPVDVSIQGIDSYQSANNYPDGRQNSSPFIALIKNWYDGLSDPEVLGTYAFSFNELLKGTEMTSLVVNTDSKFGGWGFNTNTIDGYHNYHCEETIEGKFCSFIKPDEANVLDLQSLKSRPLFNKNPNDAALYSDVTVDKSILPTFLRERLLANEIPALTFAAGHRGVSAVAKNVDIRERYLRSVVGAPWPRPTSTYEWRHSDIFNVGYPYLYRLFDDWVKLSKGGDIHVD